VKSIKILGVDPGSIKAGMAVLEVAGSKIKLCESVTLRFSKQDFLGRLKEIYQHTYELCLQFAPHQLAFEALIYRKSPQSLIKLSQARGAMISACLNAASVPIAEYAPNLIKTTVAGHGHASKASVDKMLQLTLGRHQFSSEDASDAAAVALCHAFYLRSNTQYAMTNKPAGGTINL
jgi:crossover junction endodeoxyribonuclease RuvC